MVREKHGPWLEFHAGAHPLLPKIGVCGGSWGAERRHSLSVGVRCAISGTLLQTTDQMLPGAERRIFAYDVSTAIALPTCKSRQSFAMQRRDG